MTLMMFFMLFNYTTLRNIKDSLIVMDAGPEAIPFFKGYNPAILSVVCDNL